ncbi:MAG: NTP transferase domain-containing protein [Planctomycetales bacterium]|nr:NTP transferase domain-containing protein [Planctomycetales bacterium]
MSAASAMAVVLAAGKGTRMQSELPKVLVPACGRPMVRYVIDALRTAGVGRIVVVVGYRSDLVRAELADVPALEFVEQTEQLGTGHAVMMCREQLAQHAGPVVIVTGDSPLLQPSSVEKLLAELNSQNAACVLGTIQKDDPDGFGRIVRDVAGQFTGIVEQKDATAEQLAVREVNASTYVFDAAALLGALDKITAENAQGEYYVTDCPAILLAEGRTVLALPALASCESLSVNRVEDLPAVEAALRELGYAAEL